MEGARWDFIMMRTAKARAEASRCVAALLTQWERKVVCEIDAACWRVCVRRHHLHDQIFHVTCVGFVQRVGWTFLLGADSFTTTARERWAVCNTYGKSRMIY